MRKKKISRMLILRFINLYSRESHTDGECLSFEISRMYEYDRPRCAMVSSNREFIIKLAKSRNTDLALICNKKHIIKILKTDSCSDYDEKTKRMTVTKGGTDKYSECWVKSGRNCYTGIAVAEWSTIPFAQRVRIYKLVKAFTPWTSILDLTSGKMIDLTKWSFRS